MYTFVAVFYAALLAAGAPSAQQCERDGDREIIGSVWDEVTRRRIPDARVTVVSTATGARKLETRTDENGAFRVCLRASGFPVLIYAEHSGRISAAIELEAPPAGENPRVVVALGSPIRLGGRIFDQGSGRGVGSVEVTVGRYFTTVTDRNGRFEFTGLPGGEFTLGSSHLGFQSVSETVRLVPGVNVDVSVPLSVEAVEVAPVVVTARSKGLEQVGFYQRRQTGQGSYLNRSDIDRMRGISVPSDLLRGFSGVSVVRRSNGRGFSVVGRNQCPYRYYVDGVRIGPGFALDDLEWHWIDAIEVYNGLGQIPARFAEADPVNVRACGVVVVWTRQVAR